MAAWGQGLQFLRLVRVDQADFLPRPRREGCRGGLKRQGTCSTSPRFGIDDELSPPGSTLEPSCCPMVCRSGQPVTEEAIY